MFRNLSDVLSALVRVLRETLEQRKTEFDWLKSHAGLATKSDLESWKQDMANIALAIFLLLFGVTMLVSTNIPGWVVGLAAVITGLIVGFAGWTRKP